MTLLTIEEIDSGKQLLKEKPNVRVANFYFECLLATARAYWELKKLKRMPIIDLDDPNYPDCREITEDKPHAPTIKAIVEAMEGAKYRHHGYASISLNLDSVIKSLEKHLE